MHVIRFVLWSYLAVFLGVLLFAFIAAAMGNMQLAEQIVRNGFTIAFLPIVLLWNVFCSILVQTWPEAAINGPNLLGLMILLFFVYLVWHFMIGPIARFAIRKGESGGSSHK